MGERVTRLEACRGIAAIIVVIFHTLWAFEPTIVGFTVGDRTSYSLSGTIFYTLINGVGAVVFFFVLSGYVLTAKFFEKPDPDLIVHAVLKRLPRLAGITTIVTVTSALIWLSGLYYYREAAQLSGSGWLATFGYVNLPDDFVPTIGNAIAQGAWRTFFSGDNYLDISLWTMHHEFCGSLLVFLAAPFLVYVLRGNLVWLLFLLGIALFRYIDVYMIPFLCGLAIAYFERSMTLFRSPWVTSGLLLAGLYLLGFQFPDRDYSIFALLPVLHSGKPASEIYQYLILSMGASAIILAILRSPTAEEIFGNKIGAFLGRLSFPIYLVHVLVICSASSFVYVRMFPLLGRAAIYPAAVCTLSITLLVALPLAKIDVTWVRLLNSTLTRRWVPNRPASTGSAQREVGEGHLAPAASPHSPQTALPHPS